MLLYNHAATEGFCKNNFAVTNSAVRRTGIFYSTMYISFRKVILEGQGQKGAVSRRSRLANLVFYQVKGQGMMVP